MQRHCLPLTVLEETIAICRLPAGAPPPTWAERSPFLSITRTANELSVVCRQEIVPEGIPCERSWRCLRVAGNLDFSLVGVLASLVTPLADAGVGVLAISTFDTDYLLVREGDLARAVDMLGQAGHSVTE